MRCQLRLCKLKGAHRGNHWLINCIDTKAKCTKCSHLKKLTCKGTLRHGLICLRPSTIPPPPLHTCILVRVYSIFIHTGKRGWRGGGGELNQRKCKRGNISQSWVENTNMNDCISSPSSCTTLGLSNLLSQIIVFSAFPSGMKACWSIKVQIKFTLVSSPNEVRRVISLLDPLEDILKWRNFLFPKS